MASFFLSYNDFQGKMQAGLLSMFETPYFNALLQANPRKHPIIFVKGVKYHIMAHLLRFMYEGQTKIKSQHIYHFIETAQELQIKWLQDIDNQTNDNNDSNLNTQVASSNGIEVIEGEQVKIIKTKRIHQNETNEYNSCSSEELFVPIVPIMMKQEPDEPADELQGEASTNMSTRSMVAKEGEPVRVTFFKVAKTMYWTTWRCARCTNTACLAAIVLTNDNHIVMENVHTHDPAQSTAGQRKCAID